MRTGLKVSGPTAAASTRQKGAPPFFATVLACKEASYSGVGARARTIGLTGRLRVRLRRSMAANLLAIPCRHGSSSGSPCQIIGCWLRSRSRELRDCNVNVDGVRVRIHDAIGVCNGRCVAGADHGVLVYHRLEALHDQWAQCVIRVVRERIAVVEP